MPIYEYESMERDKACLKCRSRFEVFQTLRDPPLTACPACSRPVRKVISWCRAAVMETADEYQRINQQVADYEKSGMWSHAAELADTHAHKSKDQDLKMRAIDNYEKAGYDSKTLERHAKSNNDD